MGQIHVGSIGEVGHENTVEKVLLRKALESTSIKENDAWCKWRAVQCLCRRIQDFVNGQVSTDRAKRFRKALEGIKDNKYAKCLVEFTRSLGDEAL